MKSYPISQSALYKITSKKKLADILLLCKDELNELSSSPKYRTKSSKKKDGSLRIIYNPDGALKNVQKRIHLLLTKIEKPDFVMASKGRSYRDNALYHCGNDYFMMADIASFYEKCSRGWVYRFFREKMLCAPDVAHLLTDLTVYENVLPTGSPCSQILAYFAYEDMFSEINEVARKYNCTFTIYVDDMCFSSKTPFSERQLVYEVEGVLRKYGHHINRKKTKYRGRHDYKLITGAVVTPGHDVVVPNKLGKKIVWGMRSMKESGDLSDIASIRGRVCAASYVANTVKFRTVSDEIDKMLL